MKNLENYCQHNDPKYQGFRTKRTKRVFDKYGDENVQILKIPKSIWWYFQDFFTSLVDEKWRYVLSVFALSYFVTWIVFAILWYIVAYNHGDLIFDPITNKRLNSEPCADGARSFITVFLLSVEIQTSIGFGENCVTANCSEGLFLLVAQLIVAYAIEGAMIGTVFAKMIRPPKLSSEKKFSKTAVICQRDSKNCLIFRVCDPRGNHVVGTKISADWYVERFSGEGEKIQDFEQSLKLENDGQVFLIFPTTICHVIDETSPLYDLSAMDLFETKFEIVITMTGCSRSTGQLSQVRTSYLPKEIIWGNRFINLTSYDPINNVHVANYDNFDETEVVDFPLCSARKMEEAIGENDYDEY